MHPTIKAININAPKNTSNTLYGIEHFHSHNTQFGATMRRFVRRKIKPRMFTVLPALLCRTHGRMDHYKTLLENNRKPCALLQILRLLLMPF